MTKIQVVTLSEEGTVDSQIDRWLALGWHFRGFLRRGPGIWDRTQALFEREVPPAMEREGQLVVEREVPLVV